MGLRVGKNTNNSFLGKRQQRDEGSRISIFMDINNLYIRSLFNELSLGPGIILVVGRGGRGDGRHGQSVRGGFTAFEGVGAAHALTH